MTICFNTNYDTMQFFARCMYHYNKGCKDCCFPNFDGVEISATCFNQVSVKTDKSIQDVENLLKSCKVRYNWVNQY